MPRAGRNGTTLGILDPAAWPCSPGLGPPNRPPRRPARSRAADGFGPRAAELAAELAAHVEAWDLASQPAIAGLHVDAYPRSGPGRAPLVPDALIMERPGNRFLIYHT